MDLGILNNIMTVNISDSAAAQISKILENESQESVVRVSVYGGGCSGFQYSFQIDQNINDDDLIIEEGSAKVAIDSMTLVYMEGSTIDYVSDMMSAAFKVDNPNATACCGCGSSFTV